MTITGYGAVDPLAAVARYTTVAAVKRAIGIDSVEWDTEVLQAIVTLEYLMDAYMEHSFPDPVDPDAGTDDAIDPPPIEGIPEAVRQAALLGSIEVFKAPDMPGGIGGSDEFIGQIDIPGRAREAFRGVRAQLLGFRRAGGFA